MKKTKIFIDGGEGTTGLKLKDRLADRNDLEILSIDEKFRKDAAAKKEIINASDLTFLCLPDAAAKESVALAGDKVKIIDASTAHRTAGNFTYGFPELDKTIRDNIIKSYRVAVPGCHASGFAAIVYPLIKTNALPKDYPFSCYSLTGYSGGGKKLIADYEDKNRNPLFAYPRFYAITQEHKHLKEMKYICSISSEPVFSPILMDIYSGMAVTVPIDLTKTDLDAKSIHNLLKAHYTEGLVSVMEFNEGSDASGIIASAEMAGKSGMKIYVSGSGKRVSVTAVYDNLEKGASGAAVQCMNLMIGVDEFIGL